MEPAADLFPFVTPECRQLFKPSIDFAAYLLLSELVSANTSGWTQAHGLSVGMKTACKALNANVVDVVFVATDVDGECPKAADMLLRLRRMAAKRGVPVVYALGRAFMSRAMGCQKSLSAVAITRHATLTAEQRVCLSALLLLTKEACEEFTSCVHGA